MTTRVPLHLLKTQLIIKEQGISTLATIPVRELISNGTLTLTYLSTNEMVADGLTKALTPVKFTNFVGMLGLRDDEL